MNRFLKACFVFTCLPVSAICTVWAEETIVTDWLQAKKGDSGGVIGAEVIGVDETQEGTTVDVELPVDQLLDYESVEIISRQNRQFIEQTNQAQPLLDSSGQPYGLRLHLKALPRYDFRIRLHSSDE